MIRLTRTIEYEYESIEDMAGDLARWMLPERKWFSFNGKKRARSTITGMASDDQTVDTEHLADTAAAALKASPGGRA